MENTVTLLYELLLAMTLALIVGKLFEEFFARIKMPPVIGDLLAGLLLGASFLSIFPSNIFIKSIAWLGIITLLFYAGLETRYRDFMKNLKTYAVITLGEAFAAFGIGFSIGILFGYPPRSAYFIGAVLEATSVSVSVRTLIEIGKLSTREAHTILGVAVLDDLTALITIVIGESIIRAQEINVFVIASTVITAFMFWFLTVIILHHVSNFILRRTLKLHIEEAISSILLGILSLIGYLTIYLKISPLIAAYAVGLAFSEAIGVKRVLEKIKFLSLTFSVIFFMVTSAEINIWTTLKPEYTIFYILIVLGAFAGKILGGGLTSYLIGFPFKSALRIAIGLFPRAEFCIIAAYMGYMLGLFGAEVYLSALLIVLITNIITPPLLKITFGKE